MEMNQLKKMLAGLSIASLIAGSSLGVSGCANGKSAWGGSKPDAGSTQTEKKAGSSWGGTKPGAGSTDEKPVAPSSWSGTKTPAPSSWSGKK